MTAFSMLGYDAQLALEFVMLQVSMAVLALIFYRFVSVGKFRECIPDVLLFWALLILLSFLKGADRSNTETPYFVKLNVFFILSVAATVVLYCVIGLRLQRARNKNTLTPSAVKETLDDLHTGICFTDLDGRIILINHAMNDLVESLIGTYPQTLDEIHNALDIKAEKNGELYILPNGTVWRLSETALTNPGLENCRQTAAFDVTELYSANENLKEENEELRRTNEKLAAMYERIADRIREEETLNLRIRVHDDIGASLIALSELLNSDSDADADTELLVLQNAVSYIGGSSSFEAGSFEELRQKAAQVNAKLQLDGEVPEGETARRLFEIATRECVTNCIRHALGDEVYINVEKLDGAYSVSYTNNGRPPAGEITEGGGLSALRKSVEAVGGTMKLYSKPEFKLELTLPEKETL